MPDVVTSDNQTEVEKAFNTPPTKPVTAAVVLGLAGGCSLRALPRTVNVPRHLLSHRVRDGGAL